MEKMARNFRPQPSRAIKPGTDPSTILKKPGTYLSLISCILQDSPTKMLTFSELMDRVRPFVSGDQKRVENNIRVCLSANNCFVRIPVSSCMQNCRGCWKLDHSKITAKMVRRHFKGVLHRFPELASKVETETAARSSKPNTTVPSPLPTACISVQTRHESKFRGSFSIESILGGSSSSCGPSNNHPSPGASHSPSGEPGHRVEDSSELRTQANRRRSWYVASSVSNPVYTPGIHTRGQCCADGGTGPVKRTRGEPTPVIYTSPGVPLSYTGPHNSYVVCPLPKAAPDGRHFFF